MRDKKLMWDISFEKFFERFCEGTCSYGPLGFWKASLEWPERVMFVRYEDMKKDPSFHLKRLAGFMGYPFYVEEEREGVCGYHWPGLGSLNQPAQPKGPDGTRP